MEKTKKLSPTISSYDRNFIKEKVTVQNREQRSQNREQVCSKITKRPIYFSINTKNTAYFINI